MTTGLFYDIQGFSVHDGPGIRLTCFMKGCPLRCMWCHSPESQRFGQELNQMELKCAGIENCGHCIEICPQGAIFPGHKRAGALDEVTVPQVDRAKCVGCFTCARGCPTRSLYICGEEYTPERLMVRVLREKPFFDNSGGGVTVSGGECLNQHEFLTEFLKLCKESGIHTAVDSTGFAKYEIISQILPYTDLFLYDLKFMDSEKHKRFTGVPNELILENARKISEDGGSIQFRIPVIPPLNDSEEEIRESGKFISELSERCNSVQILPYHKLGVVKWERLGRTPDLNDPEYEKVYVPTDDHMKNLKGILEEYGLNVTIH